MSRIIKGIEKGETAFAGFCATLNLAQWGLHHKTFRGHVDTMLQACQGVATATDAGSVQVIKGLYHNFLNPVKTVNIIFDGTRKTRGHN